MYDTNEMSARCPVLGFSAGTHPTNPGGSCAADPAGIAYLKEMIRLSYHCKTYHARP